MAPTMRAIQSEASPFAAVDAPSTLELQSERVVRYLLVSGRQDDGVWGPVGAVWLSADGLRGGFLIHPWAIDLGAEMVRSYRGAIARGFTPSTIFDYWAKEPWTGSNVVVEEERAAETLLLVNELLNVL
ncbi:MAG: hypothetical protein ACXVP3_01640 [Actinomycetota bacterium]